jgi:hypothetical protein
MTAQLAIHPSAPVSIPAAGFTRRQGIPRHQLSGQMDGRRKKRMDEAILFMCHLCFILVTTHP